MSARLAAAFARAKAENRAALVIYLCAGDPELATTARLIVAAAKAGADVVEVGMPFSDPTADGPVIQRASERALARGTTVRGVLGAVREARTQLPAETAVVLFGYYNPLLAYGEARVAREAAEAGVDGFLVVDLPPTHAGPLHDALRENGLDFVPLIAPTSTPERIAEAAAIAGSFLYYVSITGITGGASADLSAAAKAAGRVQAAAGKPVALGFGVKTEADVRAVAPHVDGVVVGSAVVLAIEATGSPDEAVAAVEALVRSLARGTHR